jgi:hypothetical protein
MEKCEEESHYIKIQTHTSTNYLSPINLRGIFSHFAHNFIFLFDKSCLIYLLVLSDKLHKINTNEKGLSLSSSPFGCVFRCSFVKNVGSNQIWHWFFKSDKFFISKSFQIKPRTTLLASLTHFQILSNEEHPSLIITLSLSLSLFHFF